MEEPSGSYAPQSPDLSGVSYYPADSPSTYYPRPQHPQPLQQQQQQQQQQPPPPPPQQHLQSSALPPYPSHQSVETGHAQYPNYQQQQYDQHSPSSYYSHPAPTYPYSNQPQSMPVATRSGRVKKEDLNWLPPAAMPSVAPPLPLATSPFAAPVGGVERKLAPGEADGIVVKTKFPVARIKRIVQADEDIGKVAQVTPVVVAKALELFMISLATKSADEARARGSKKITGAHLKQAVQKDEQFDFLNDIVAKIADAPSAKKDRDEDSDDAADGAGSIKRKKSAATGRKRKDPEDS